LFEIHAACGKGGSVEQTSTAVKSRTRTEVNEEIVDVKNTHGSAFSKFTISN